MLVNGNCVIDDFERFINEPYYVGNDELIQILFMESSKIGDYQQIPFGIRINHLYLILSVTLQSKINFFIHTPIGRLQAFGLPLIRSRGI